MLYLFRSKMFFIVKYFNDFLQYIFGSLACTKKLPMTKFCHWPAGFWPLSPDSDYYCWILASLVGIRRQWPNSD
jgi:hypothetical protein